MKLAICVLLSLAALAWADTSYQNYQTYQNNQNNYPDYHEGSAPSNYYQGGAPGQRRQGIVDSVRDFFSPSTRRTFGLLGGGPFIVIIVVVFIGIGAIITATVIFSNINSSGRGLDTDEWEVDHSVWMNQLQKDFEDSWAIE